MKHPNVMIFEEEKMVVLRGKPAEAFADLVERLRKAQESGEAVDTERFVDYVCDDIASGQL